WRECLTVAENARAEQKQLSQEYARTREASDLDRAKHVGEEAKSQMARAEELKRELDDLLLRVPNVFHPSVPIGSSEADNVVVREWGSKPSFEFEPRTHYDIGESLGIMDFERAARVAGSRFAFLRGAGAPLEGAPVPFVLDLHTRGQRFGEVLPPPLAHDDS